MNEEDREAKSTSKYLKFLYIPETEELDMHVEALSMMPHELWVDEYMAKKRRRLHETDII